MSRTLLLAAAGAAAAVALVALNVWAARQGESRRKSIQFTQATVAIVALLYALLTRYLRPLLIEKPAWPAWLRPLLRGAFNVFGGMTLLVHPITRSLSGFLPASSDPHPFVLVIFSCFGVFTILMTTVVLVDAVYFVVALGIEALATTATAPAAAAAASVAPAAPAVVNPSAEAEAATAAVSSTAAPVRQRRAGPGRSPPAAAAPADDAAAPPAAAAAAATPAAGKSQPSATWPLRAADVLRRAWHRRSGWPLPLAAAVVAFTTVVAVAAVVSATKPPTVVRYEAPLLRLPASLDGYTIAQLSDIHVGPTVGATRVRELVDVVNSLSVDMVVLTGDIIDGDEGTYRQAVQPLEGLRTRASTPAACGGEGDRSPCAPPPAPLDSQLVGRAVFFASGNHDHYDGSFVEKVAIMRALGATPLINERVPVPRHAVGEWVGTATNDTFDLIGVTDWAAAPLSGPEYTADLGRAIAGRDPSREAVLLAHQPKHIAHSGPAGIGLQLTGHTHGGQIFPLHLPVWLGNPYFAGAYTHETISGSVLPPATRTPGSHAAHSFPGAGSVEHGTHGAGVAGLEAVDDTPASLLAHSGAEKDHVGAALRAVEALAQRVLSSPGLRGGASAAAAKAGGAALPPKSSGSSDHSPSLASRLLAAASSVSLRQVWPTHLYINRGSIYWGPPMRLFSPHEVTIITLRSAEAMVAAAH